MSKREEIFEQSNKGNNGNFNKMNAKFVILWGKPHDPEAFEHHYRNIHIPLAKKLIGLRSYTISHNIVPIRGESYYQVAELIWDSMIELKKAFNSPEGQETSRDVEILKKLNPSVRSMIYEAEEV